MNLDRLNTFTIAAEVLNFTHAARRLQLSQPAISQQIRELEDDFGVTLFERRGRTLILTPAGERLRPMALSLIQEIRNIQEQLVQIQELTGASQQRLLDLRRDLEERPVPPPTAIPGDTTRAAAVAPAAGAAPGPATLYKLAFDQMSRGSHSTARSGFQTLLDQYPTSDLAPDAQYYIGETLQAEGNTSGADSVFSLVVSKYPSAPRAATALYKHGLFLQKAKRDREARQAFQTVIDKYPRSDEAALAREQLRRGSE
jgi:tol-pal system protein YbgF